MTLQKYHSVKCLFGELTHLLPTKKLALITGKKESKLSILSPLISKECNSYQLCNSFNACFDAFSIIWPFSGETLQFS